MSTHSTVESSGSVGRRRADGGGRVFGPVGREEVSVYRLVLSGKSCGFS